MLGNSQHTSSCCTKAGPDSMLTHGCALPQQAWRQKPLHCVLVLRTSLSVANETDDRQAKCEPQQISTDVRSVLTRTLPFRPQVCLQSYPLYKPRRVSVIWCCANSRQIRALRPWTPVQRLPRNINARELKTDWSSHHVGVR